ncbi:mandelate racemase/muconate lactonizing enzyme family protein [Tessaracoccus sp. MC1865]|uniref:mandelate racemase/muconate lactonizing enzyme family protein n=1 Tax=Tessaracoccus sp. MC1865 TaxID=2760310 RepID=UPI00160176BB|nr:mandelate racemase/muconate lactonizing enzyme family protein [Tessaracoccus sp. MC1865]MBB1482910.1 mandelate racemase/muconate lactonizing enzyme family protein [Tessaracoccus sp. MC1865]QTO37651.1 mandelate racemase/muconate lactonizing enzyme family protein [Tessaracoccus sp. MC1865]
MITELEAWTVPYTEPNDHGSTRFVTICRLTDDAGNHGWGEAVTIAPEAARATTIVLRTWAESILGTPATPAGVGLFAEQRGWWYGTFGGVSGFATAALDTAVWDLLGRRLGASVVDLLGGARHESLPTIVTSHAMRADLRQGAEEFAQWAQRLGAAGVKVGFGKAGDAHLGFEHERDVAFLSEIRRALGEKAQILIDVSPRVAWSPSDAIRRVLAFEEYGLHWIEEPLGARDPEGYARLRDATSTLIAYGEREWTVGGMAEILATGTVDVLGIDPGRAGGISGFRAGAELAAAHHRQVNAHAFAGPISYAGGLAVSLASANCRQFEVAPLRNTLITELSPALPLPVDGLVSPLEGSGLGVEIDVERLLAVAET